ncbi:RNA recognition motif domain-containing protein [Flavobacterium gelatinilyticum]|uniref:RNA recognition motif domain-containing protein n=1 Tax=Flavobacterium gelatinilyticum TaxID=3003260 RepID=UPI002480ED9A|nr:RNA-binding protein [Flavobacterium gelatinilyticum]
MNIFVAKLGFGTSEDQVRDAFAAYGTVTSVKIIMDPFTGRSKCFGFVEMPDQSDAEKAIKGLNNSELDSQTVVVNEARPKPDVLDYSSSRGASNYSKDRRR